METELAEVTRELGTLITRIGQAVQPSCSTEDLFQLKSALQDAQSAIDRIVNVRRILAKS